MRKENICLPYQFTPRDYQLPVFVQVPYQKKRGVCVWHRRSGKDKTFLNMMTTQMYEAPGTYFYLFPTFAQARKVVWDGIDRDGFRFLNHFPDPWIVGMNNSEMKITVEGKNRQTDKTERSIFQLIGTDNFDYIMGTNPRGCVFSEYSLQNPAAWDYIRPILVENEGWALFNYTPRAENHGYELYQIALNNPNYYCSLLTVNDTKKPDGSPVISQEAIQQEREAGMSEDMIEQEFYCSFEAMNRGTYYGEQFKILYKEGRIGDFQWDPNRPVQTYWDIGIGDSNAIWFVQTDGKEYRVIDYYENNNKSLKHYCLYCHKLPYQYNRHVAPHDMENREYSTGMSRKEKALEYGIDFEIAPNIPLEDGIEAVRSILPRCYFDSRKEIDRDNGGRIGAGYGVQALKNYSKEYDSKRKIYKNMPDHNWASHGSDSFRYLAVSQGDTPRTGTTIGLL